MEELYYILDTSTNLIVIDNLTYEQSMNWLIENGDPILHTLLKK